MSKRANLAAALHDAGAKPTQAISPVELEARPMLAAAPTTATYRPPSRAGQRAITHYAKPEAHKQLRLLCLERDGNVQELMTEALNDLFHKYGKSIIA